VVKLRAKSEQLAVLKNAEQEAQHGLHDFNGGQQQEF
jgi:hypothetical protein